MGIRLQSEARSHARNDGLNRVATELYLFLRKNDNDYGRRNQIRVRESITQGEGISTPHVRCTQREPLGQLCALVLVKILGFSNY